MKTSPDQTSVSIDEVTVALQRLLKGLMAPADVKNAINVFISDHGIVSLVTDMNKNEFKKLLNQIIDDWISEVDKNGDGVISKAEFMANVEEVMGWQAWLVRGHMKKTFTNATKVADRDGDGNLSRDEIIFLLKMFAEGELSVDKVVELPRIFRR